MADMSFVAFSAAFEEGGEVGILPPRLARGSDRKVLEANLNNKDGRFRSIVCCSGTSQHVSNLGRTFFHKFLNGYQLKEHLLFKAIHSFQQLG